jgi:hypothetical protein
MQRCAMTTDRRPSPMPAEQEQRIDDGVDVAMVAAAGKPEFRAGELAATGAYGQDGGPDPWRLSSTTRSVREAREASR